MTGQNQGQQITLRDASIAVLVIGGVMFLVGLDVPIVVGGIMLYIGYWMYKNS